MVHLEVHRELMGPRRVLQEVRHHVGREGPVDVRVESIGLVEDDGGGPRVAVQVLRRVGDPLTLQRSQQAADAHVGSARMTLWSPITTHFK